MLLICRINFLYVLPKSKNLIHRKKEITYKKQPRTWYSLFTWSIRLCWLIKLWWYFKQKQKKIIPRQTKRANTSKALSTCSGAIVLLSSLLQTSLDSDDTRLINSVGVYHQSNRSVNNIEKYITVKLQRPPTIKVARMIIVQLIEAKVEKKGGEWEPMLTYTTLNQKILSISCYTNIWRQHLFNNFSHSCWKTKS